VVLRAGEEKLLREWMRASSGSAGLAQRARILLLAAQGHFNTEIGRLVGVSLPTVRLWRSRYGAGGVGGLGDLARSGRPAGHDETSIIAATLDPPPEYLGVTHWSARLLAHHLGISFATVAGIWRRWGLKQWKAETFKFSTDPGLEAKIRDVVGLYLDPPAKAVVVCIDEKTQIQALVRTAPILPIRPGVPEKQTSDYVRNGTTTLFAGLEIATGLVTDRRRVLGVPQASRPRLPPGPPARGLRQLRHPQAPQRQGLADQAPPGPAALHPDQRRGRQ